MVWKRQTRHRDRIVKLGLLEIDGGSAGLSGTGGEKDSRPMGLPRLDFYSSCKFP